jgi:hypothetical protein
MLQLIFTRWLRCHFGSSIEQHPPGLAGSFARSERFRPVGSRAAAADGRAVFSLLEKLRTLP